MENPLPSIPTKRYFTISEVGRLCGVKPHVLRYWEQEFTQLRPTKRRGNRRYYQLHEVQLIRKIRELLYEQGFTIVGARNKLQETVTDASNENFLVDRLQKESKLLVKADCVAIATPGGFKEFSILAGQLVEKPGEPSEPGFGMTRSLLHQVRDELLDIRKLLEPFA